MKESLKGLKYRRAALLLEQDGYVYAGSTKGSVVKVFYTKDNSRVVLSLSGCGEFDDLVEAVEESSR